MVAPLRGFRVASSFRTQPTAVGRSPAAEGASGNPVIKRCILAVALVAAGTAAPSRAMAQTISSPYAFLETRQGFYGYGTYIFTDRGALETGPRSGPAAGLGYSIRLSGPFVLDGRVASFPTTRSVYEMDTLFQDTARLREDPMADLTEIGEADLSLLVIDASLRFDLTGPRTWYRLQPYALIGAGAVIGVSSDNSIEEELPSDLDIRVRFRNGVTGHVGAGVEWHATERLTLRLDARDLLWKLHLPGDFLRPGRVIDTDEWVQTAHLSAGLGFRF